MALQVVLNLGRQQVSVLEADLGGRAFQVHLDPAVVLGAAGGILQARIGLRFSETSVSARPSRSSGRENGSASHCRYYSKESMPETSPAPKTDGAREGRGLSVQAESKVVGPGFGERAPLGR